MKEIDLNKIAIFLIVLIITLFLCFMMVRDMFYSLTPHSTAQNALGDITGQECINTKVTYYRYAPGFLGIPTSVETTKELADYSSEACVR